MLLLNTHAILMLIHASLTRESLLLLHTALNHPLTWVSITLHILSAPSHLCHVDFVIHGLTHLIRLVNIQVKCKPCLSDPILDLFLKEIVLHLLF